MLCPSGQKSGFPPTALCLCLSLPVMFKGSLYLPVFLPTLELLLLNFKHLASSRWDINLESFGWKCCESVRFSSKKRKEKNTWEKTIVAPMWGQASTIHRDILAGTYLLRGNRRVKGIYVWDYRNVSNHTCTLLLKVPREKQKHSPGQSESRIEKIKLSI